MRGRVFAVRIAVFAIYAGSIATAQAPVPARPTAKAAANLAQIMRGILLPNSNIIFDAQSNDPAKKKDEVDNVDGGWVSVENAALALAESANLLIIPNRLCRNDKPVPLGQPDWNSLVQGLRDGSMAAYKAAQTKNMDNMVDAAGTLTEACSNGHDKYREKPNLASRCTP
jgi:hypothetical protein